MIAPVIGAGIAGCILARMLAELDHYVVIYEATSVPGGILPLLDECVLHLEKPAVYNWLAERTHLIQLPPLNPYNQAARYYAPKSGYVHLCKQLLNHRGIRVQYQTEFTNVVVLTTAFNPVFYTGQLERLFHFQYGPLPYDGAIPIVTLYTQSAAQRYRALCDPVGIIPFGMRPFHDAFPIHRLIEQAAAIVARFPTR